MVINSSDAILYAIFLPFPLVVTVTTHITKPTGDTSHHMPKASARLAAQTALAYCFGSDIFLFHLSSCWEGRVAVKLSRIVFSVSIPSCHGPVSFILQLLVLERRGVGLCGGGCSLLSNESVFHSISALMGH